MNCVPGGTSRNLLIQQKEVVLSIKHIITGLLYACSCDDEWYFGVADIADIADIAEIYFCRKWWYEH